MHIWMNLVLVLQLLAALANQIGKGLEHLRTSCGVEFFMSGISG